MSKTGAIKMAWLSLAILIAVPLVVTYNPTSNRDNDIVLGYALLTLTFPSGVAVAMLYSLVGYILERLFSSQLPIGRLPMILDCMVFLTAGYVQWFVILPCRLDSSQEKATARQFVVVEIRRLHELTATH